MPQSRAIKDNGELASIKKYGKGWRDNYPSRRDVAISHTLVITASTYPSPLQPYKSIYSLRKVLDKVSNEASAFYKARGIETFIAGPEGLGADIGIPFAFLFAHWAAIQAWLHHHALGFLVRAILPVGRRVKHWLIKRAEIRRIKLIRELQPQIQLNCQFFINEGKISEDLIPYAEQLLISSEDLMVYLGKQIPYVSVHLQYLIKDSMSDNWLAMDINKASKKSIHKALKRLTKMKPGVYRSKITVG